MSTFQKTLFLCHNIKTKLRTGELLEIIRTWRQEQKQGIVSIGRGGGGGSSPYLVVPFLFDKFLISISF